MSDHDPDLLRNAEETRRLGDLVARLDAADLAMESPYDAFWTLFSANVNVSYGHVLEERPDDVTD